MSGRPLTPAQERALIALADLSEVRPKRDRARRRLGLPREFFTVSRFARSIVTAEILERRGLVEIRTRPARMLAIVPSRMAGSATYSYEARITEAGRAMLASTGD